jgi:hypothetical protein
VTEEPREIEVVEVGRGPSRPSRPPRNRTDVLLTLLVVGVFVGAACSAFTAWTVHEQAEDNRELNCVYITSGGDGSGSRTSDDLSTVERKIADVLDCDIDRG